MLHSSTQRDREEGWVCILDVDDPMIPWHHPHNGLVEDTGHSAGAALAGVARGS